MLLLVLAVAAAAPRFADLPPLPDPLGFGGPAVGVHGGVLLVAGGANFPAAPPWEGGPKVYHNRIFALLPEADAWREIGRLPRPLAYSATVETDDGLLLIGGCDAERSYPDVLRLRYADGAVTIDPLPPFPEPAAYHAAARIGSVVYSLGGQRSAERWDLSKLVYSLDLSVDQPAWQRCFSYPGRPRVKAVLAALPGPGGRPMLYLLGGEIVAHDHDAPEPSFRFVPDVLRFDPTARFGQAWTVLPPLPAPLGAAPAVAVGGRLLLASGADDSQRETPPAEHPGFSRDLLWYDPATGETTHLPGALLRGVVTTGATVWHGRVVIPSGELRPGVRTPLVQAWRLDSATVP